MKSHRAAIAACLLLFACNSTQPVESESHAERGVTALDLDLQIARPPFDSVDVNWKHRLDQAYVFVEARGSYTNVGRSLEIVFAQARDQGLEIQGPPFALYFDDPGSKPVSELRLRACLPVAPGTGVRAPLGYDILPSTTVVYAFAAGPYPEAPRAYPALYTYLQRMNWVENGPVREIYLRNPADVKDWSELVCEIQIPASLAR